uniref:Carn_acyltransf domain-containing protein n=1 Tax=Macrostomum lignano TaxID=282301 RepID=A0A1I8FMV8_9PLAT
GRQVPRATVPPAALADCRRADVAETADGVVAAAAEGGLGLAVSAAEAAAALAEGAPARAPVLHASTNKVHGGLKFGRADIGQNVEFSSAISGLSSADKRSTYCPDTMQFLRHLGGLVLLPFPASLGAPSPPIPHMPPSDKSDTSSVASWRYINGTCALRDAGGLHCICCAVNSFGVGEQLGFCCWDVLSRARSDRWTLRLVVGEHCLPGRFRESSVINVNPRESGLPRQRFCSRADWLAFCREAALGLLSSITDRWRRQAAAAGGGSPGQRQRAMRQIERSAFLLCLDRPLLQGQEWARATRAERDARMTSTCRIGLPDIPCQLLDFKPYASFNKDLAEADAALQSHIDNLQITCLEFLTLTENCFGGPPAGLLQAVYQQHCATYESGSLRRFRLGRTDTIRSCTDESHAPAQAFRVACQAHSLLTAQAVAGQGIDRHLLGLRLIAKEHGLPQHPLFDSGAFRRAQHFQLSTSQVPSQTGATMSFGRGRCQTATVSAITSLTTNSWCVSLTAYSDAARNRLGSAGGQPEGQPAGYSRPDAALHSDRPAKL